VQTYSHFIITAVLNWQLKQRELQKQALGDEPGLRIGRLPLPSLSSPALLIGSVAPDLPLILITVGMLVMDLASGQRWQPGSGEMESYVGYLFRYLFFNDPWVKAAHNLLHAPLMIFGYAVAGYWGWRKGRRWGGPLFWFALACGLHTAIDIPLHYDDGPLLFFPFNWQLRFQSPLSYWDPAHFGRQFVLFEHAFVLSLLLYWGGSRLWLRRRTPG
jgi:hypothetical protein